MFEAAYVRIDGELILCRIEELPESKFRATVGRGGDVVSIGDGDHLEEAILNAVSPENMPFAELLRRLRNNSMTRAGLLTDADYRHFDRMIEKENREKALQALVDSQDFFRDAG